MPATGEPVMEETRSDLLFLLNNADETAKVELELSGWTEAACALAVCAGNPIHAHKTTMHARGPVHSVGDAI